MRFTNPNTYEHRRQVASRYTQNILVRLFIFGRDGYKCRYCGSTKDLTIDHIVSVYEHGSNTFDNFQTLCRSCNSAKPPDMIERGLNA